MDAKNRQKVFEQEKRELIELAYAFLSGNDKRLPQKVPMEFFHTVNERQTFGIFIEVYQNAEDFPNGCFDLTFSEIEADEDGASIFADNIGSEPCTMGFIRNIINSETAEEAEKLMLQELDKFLLSDNTETIDTDGICFGRVTMSG